jgi:hypothetical protein
MASTRNKNTFGNYNLNQREQSNMNKYLLYKNSSRGIAYNTQLPGNGLNPGQIPSNQLSNNSVNTESFLFGINSTNLVKPITQPFIPEQKILTSANIFEKPDAILIPEPLVIDKYQRPFQY